jgi:hypothetical protein
MPRGCAPRARVSDSQYPCDGGERPPRHVRESPHRCRGGVPLRHGSLTSRVKPPGYLRCLASQANGLYCNRHANRPTSRCSAARRVQFFVWIPGLWSTRTGYARVVPRVTCFGRGLVGPRGGVCGGVVQFSDGLHGADVSFWKRSAAVRQREQIRRLCVRPHRARPQPTHRFQYVFSVPSDRLTRSRKALVGSGVDHLFACDTRQWVPGLRVKRGKANVRSRPTRAENKLHGLWLRLGGAVKRPCRATWRNEKRGCGEFKWVPRMYQSCDSPSRQPLTRLIRPWHSGKPA